MKKRIDTKLLIWAIAFIGTLKIIVSIYSDSYLVFYWVVLFVFLTICIKRLRGHIVNTLIIFTAFYVVLFAFGPMILFKEKCSYYKEVGNLIIISYLCFAIGYFVGGKIKIKHNMHELYFPAKEPKAVLGISIIVFCIGAGAYSIYFLKNWRYIFISDLENGRVEAMTGNGIYTWLGSLIWLSVYMLYEQSLISGKYKKGAAFMFIVSALFSILLGFRSALVNPILVLFFMTNKKKELPIRKMLFLVLGLFAFVGIYGAIRSGNGSSSKSLVSEFKVSSVNLNYILEVFPERVNYQKGATYLLDFRQLVDDNVDGVTTWLKKVLNLSFSGGGVTPTIIGEFYINWGMIGVLVGMTISGFLFTRIEQMYRNPKGSIFLSCLILGYIRPIIRGGFGNSFVTLLIYIIGYYGCQFVAKTIKIKQYDYRGLNYEKNNTV